MRFLSFARDGKPSFGAAINSGVVDLGAAHPELPDLRGAIREDRLGELASEAADSDRPRQGRPTQGLRLDEDAPELALLVAALLLNRPQQL